MECSAGLTQPTGANDSRRTREVHVRATGMLRIGWDEPDWLGPPRRVTPAGPAHLRVAPQTERIAVTTGAVLGEGRALSDETVVALRLAARVPTGG